MRYSGIGWLALCLLIGGTGATTAQSRKQQLIDQIVTSGTNEYRDERHTVEVQDCTLTTYRWREIEGEGPVLWTSLVIDMVSAEFIPNESNPEKLFIAAPDTKGSGRDVVVIQIRSRPPALIRHEKPNRRAKDKTAIPSPRNNGTTHFYEFANKRGIVQWGPQVIAKADLFTRSFQKYVRDYCSFIG